MKRNRDRFAVVGPARGSCNICETVGDLSRDHIPPKGVRRIGNTEMRRLIDQLSAQPVQPRIERSQDGVKFRSLCKECNSTRLGKYDRALADFAAAVDRACTATVLLPPTISIEIRPRAVLRSVVGHLLAFGAARSPQGDLPRSLATYFLDESLLLPARVNCFYWVYPYNDQVLVRDAGYMSAFFGNIFTFMLLKFFPLSFFVTWNLTTRLPFLVRPLTDASQSAIDARCDVLVDLVDLPPQRWPEAPTDDAAVLHGGEPLHAKPKSRIFSR